MKSVGILALQGSFIEHYYMLRELDGIKPVLVKSVDEIESIDALILPGGESTAQGKLLNDFGLTEPIKERIKGGMPVWGTCTGSILLAKKIVDEENTHLGLMDIEVKRNAYGSQLDSFKTNMLIEEVSKSPIPLVFIRAPWIERVSSNVSVLGEFDGRIIAARQDNMIVTSFHPELTSDLSFYEYLVKRI